MNRRLLLQSGVSLGAALAFRGASAQTVPGGPKAPGNYPVRPIEFVVPFPAGGGVDVTARILAQESERVLHHAFRVQNRVGGAGLIGHTYLAKSAPADGYSVGVVANPFLVIDFLFRNGDFNQDSFSPLTGINYTPVSWVVRSDSALGKLDFKGVIAQAKAKPGEIKIGVLPNTPFEFVTEIVERATGSKLLHVPFQGGGPAVTSLLGGNIDITNAFYDEVEQQVRAGQLKVLAVSNDTRYPVIPDVPTMNELGVPMPHNVWGATRLTLVPPATPEAIKAYLSAAFLEVLRDPTTVEAYKKAGILLSPTDRAETEKAFTSTVTTIRSFLKETGRSKN